MLSFFKDTVDANATNEKGFFLIIVSEKFSKYNYIRIC